LLLKELEVLKVSVLGDLRLDDLTRTFGFYL
jgi:hypothetical protein